MDHLTARMVHYRLNAEDVEQIDVEIPQRNEKTGRYYRNPVREGEALPAMVTAAFITHEDSGPVVLLNLQVILDGPSNYWVTSRRSGDRPGEWTWAAKAHLAGVDYIPPAEG